MYSGSFSRSERLMASVCSSRWVGMRYATSLLSPCVSSRTITAACRTPGHSLSTASISPNSMRKPRTFTWKSIRPKYSMLPSARQRHRSPVLYMRAVSSPPNGSGVNRSAVSSGRFKYPRATPSPAMKSSPATPMGTGFKLPSNRYTRVFAIGLPIGVGFSAELTS